VAVIDESLAQKYFSGRDPIGQYLDNDFESTGSDKRPPAQIVGVVGHVNQWGLDQDGPDALHAEVYQPYWQYDDKSVVAAARYNTIYVRTRQSGAPSIDTLRRRLLQFDSGLVVYDANNMETVVAKTIAAKRFIMMVLGTFAAIALLLAGVGIYGVLSYLVGQRTQEIGVRMALGAQRLDVLRIVLGDGLRMTVIGLAVGLISAVALTRLMSKLLFGVKPTDPITFAGVACLLLAIAFVACYVPAYRAMRVNPTVALRYE
jgi:ABC-type antimicrobial peptide transport system permease subunit